HRGSVIMEDKSEFDHCAELLSALAAPDRLRIVQLLRLGPRSVGEIADELHIRIVNLSHHLTVLRHAGLVRNERQGRYIFYSLAPEVVQEEDEDPKSEHLNLGCCRLELPRPEGPE